MLRKEKARNEKTTSSCKATAIIQIELKIIDILLVFMGQKKVERCKDGCNITWRIRQTQYSSRNQRNL